MRLSECRTHDIRIREHDDESIEVIQGSEVVARASRKKDGNWTSRRVDAKRTKELQEHASRADAIGRLVSAAMVPALEIGAAGGGTPPITDKAAADA